MNSNNPLLNTFTTPFDTIPFDKLTTKDLEEAILYAIEIEKNAITNIIEDKASPTFENTIVALEDAGESLSFFSGILYNLSHAESNEEIENLLQKLSPILSEHSSRIFLNRNLFKKIKVIYDNARQSNITLTKEQQMLLEKTYEAFEANGAHLEGTNKEKFVILKKELSELVIQFSQNHLKDTNNFSLFVENENEIEGLPELQKNEAKNAAKAQEKNGFLFNLKAPSYIPFLKYVDNRTLRKTMYLAYNTLCMQNNAYNNHEIVKKIINKRREIAQLLGYECYADLALKNRMAKTSKNVYNLLHELVSAYLPIAKEEVESIKEMAKKDNIADFSPWDFAYYTQKDYVSKFNFNLEKLRPYFSIEKVKQGIFGLANTLYDITFKRNTSIPVYHPEVETYEVYDKEGAFLSIFYLDLYPRDSKQSGAWMTSYREQSIKHRPFISIVMNLTRPNGDTPSLLSIDEVRTFLHEFGHALHGMFANTTYTSLSGTNVDRDFVELPSQFMENFLFEKEFLETFAKHYQTGELIPQEYINIVKKSSNYHAAYACIRQVSFGLLDMAFYTSKHHFDKDLCEFENQVWKDINLIEKRNRTCMSVQFDHIMAGGYSAGYYSYKWAEVLDADAFSYFKENGIFNKDIATSFRDNVLSKGGTIDPMDLYIQFRQQKPSILALMERDGIKMKKDESKKAN